MGIFDDFETKEQKEKVDSGAVGQVKSHLGKAPIYFIIDDKKKPSDEERKANLAKISLKDLLTQMVQSGSSDLHLTVGSPPCSRVDGKIFRMWEYAELTADKVQQLTYSVLKDKQKKDFEQNNELDFSFGIQKISRFRANIFKQRGAISCAIRVIPYEIMSFEKLNLPPAVSDFVEMPKGLVLVTGPTGCGKTTTLATMVDYINKHKPYHIMTIEDPIEYTHSHRMSIINQRQVGEDTESFPTALKYVLREDPDVIMIGEMRDLETIGAAITIAETGHLVFATLHTNSAIESINRMIDVFPAHQQSQVRTQLAFVLQGIMTQQLISKIGGGRLLVCEVLVPTAAVRAMIREDKLHQVYSSMQTGKQFKMLTMNDSLAIAVKNGFVTKQEALIRSMQKEELRELFKHYGIA